MGGLFGGANATPPLPPPPPPAAIPPTAANPAVSMAGAQQASAAAKASGAGFADTLKTSSEGSLGATTTGKPGLLGG